MVSLPNEWMKKNNLQKGDVVYIEENGDNEITLSPKEKAKKRELKEIIINGTGKDFEVIKREVYSAYISNFNIIKIVDENLEEKSRYIRDAVHGLVALEIMGQTKNMIIARDFLNVKKISISGLVRRTDIIIRNMISDTMICMKQNNFESVNERDNDINRIFFLVNRVLNRAIEDPKILNSLNLIGDDILYTHWLFMTFEKIGDECKRFCRAVTQAKLTKKEKAILHSIFKDIEKHYLDIMKAYYNKNKEIAHDVMNQKQSIMKRCDDYFEENSTLLNGVIVEKLKSFEGHIKTIARIVVDRY